MKNLFHKSFIRFTTTAVVLSMFITGFGHMTSFAHTKEESVYLSGNWQLDENGWRFYNQYKLSYVAGHWAEYQDHSYYFMDNGYMAKGWHLLNNSWYYFNPNQGKSEGAMVCGWIHDPSHGGWFYTNSSGVMVTGWHKISGYWYYFNPDSNGIFGLMATSCVVDDSYLDSNGRMNEIR